MAEGIRDVSTISDDHRNDSTCAEENGLMSWFNPVALFKLFSTSTSSTAIENERTDNGAVSTSDDHGLQEMTKALHQVRTCWSQLIFETPNGKVTLKTSLMEQLQPMRPDDKTYRNDLELTGITLINLKNSSDPLFQSLERMLSEDQEFLTVFVKAFHATLEWSITESDINLLYVEVLRILNEINEKNGYPVSRRLFWLQGLESSPHLPVTYTSTPGIPRPDPRPSRLLTYLFYSTSEQNGSTCLLKLV
ncbi:uncharacterized protein LOC105444950 [Strongylocentrotus purpuratus]|uniref:Uncharacterized protein n=1 Tax=Strongylocentrotus purpuratus TaxID=7668 RepID=A0A7M7N146_STRPU|nr:uncharacterized protein LOC105444950 [Strongylocentrotus purpuratus]